MKHRFLLTLTLILLFSSPHDAYSSGAEIHAVTGAAIGYTLAGNELQAFALGFASHALFDAIPHYDPMPFKGKIGVHEIQIGLTMGLLFDRWEASGRDGRIFFGAVGGVLPDIEHLVQFRPDGKKYFPTHNRTIKHGRQLSRDQGILLNLVLTGLAIAAIDGKTRDGTPQITLSMSF